MDPRSLSAQARETARATWTGVRSSPFDVPPKGERLARFIFGFHLTFGLLALLFRNPVDRTRYVRVVTLQILATLAVATVLAWAAPSIVSFAIPNFAQSLGRAPREHRARDHAADEKTHGPKPLAQRDAGGESDARDDDDDDGKPPAVREINVNGVRIHVATSRARDVDDAKDDDAKDDDDDDDESHTPRAPLSTPRRIVLTIIRAYASIVVAQWVVVALSRDYHDALGDRAAEQSGLPPLPGPPPVPRIRLNLRWMGKRLRDRVRAALAFAAGLPAITMVLIPISVSAAVASGWSARILDMTSNFAHGTLTFLWGSYWLAVSVCAKSPHSDKASATGEPWFYRADSHSIARVPVLGWIVRAYASVTRRLTKPLAGAAVCAERASYESAGLALAQLLVSLPLVRLGGRIVVPVAASHIVLRAQRSPPRIDVSGAVPPPPPRQDE